MSGEPIERSLFEAPPMGEQERMVEAILFASAEPVTRWGGTAPASTFQAGSKRAGTLGL